MTMKNFHVWFNSILLTMVTFFVYKTYEKIDNDHERIANHETRITVLEKSEKRDNETSMVFLMEPAILPNQEKDKKKQSI